MISQNVRYLLVGIISVGVVLASIGTGIGIGYAVCKKTKITSCEQGARPPDGTTPKSTTSIPTTLMSSAPILNTSATQSPPVDSNTTTTTEQPPAAPCPPILSGPTNSNTLLSLDGTTASTTFTKYSFAYDSSSDANTVMLMFEFATVWGSWYLDDVSVTESIGGSIGPEIIDNGGFETGNLGTKWNFCDPRYPWIIAADVVSHTSHTGSYSYESQDTSNGSEEFLTQKFSIKGNTRYTIEFYLLYNGDPTSAVVTLISH